MRNSKRKHNPKNSELNDGKIHSVFAIGNDGQNIHLGITTFFDSEMAVSGYPYLSWNDGAGRLLVPDSLASEIPQMLTGKIAVISRGPLANGQSADALELMFDDHSETPYAIQLSVDQCNLMLEESDIGIDYQLTIWTRGAMVGAMPGKYRRADSLPYLAPWSEYVTETTYCGAESTMNRKFKAKYAQLIQPFVLHFAQEILSRSDSCGVWKCTMLHDHVVISVPKTSKTFTAKDAAGQQRILSAEALGIASCIHAYREVSRAVQPAFPRLSNTYEQESLFLRAYAAVHPEFDSIRALTSNIHHE
jgi:hypothetical protein